MDFITIKGAGAALKAMRLKAGMTQIRLGELSGYSQETISKYENNKIHISTDEIVSFANHVGVGLVEFLFFCFQEVEKHCTDANSRKLLRELNFRFH